MTERTQFFGQRDLFAALTRRIAEDASGDCRAGLTACGVDRSGPAECADVRAVVGLARREENLLLDFDEVRAGLGGDDAEHRVLDEHRAVVVAAELFAG